MSLSASFTLSHRHMGRMSAKTMIKVDLFPIHKESFIPAIARTVHHAFSSDPLIRWLRPSATPWTEQPTGRGSWQYRRIQRIMFDGEVFKSGDIEELANAYPQKGKSSLSTDTPANVVTALPEKERKISMKKNGVLGSGSHDAGAVVFLFPPPGRASWSLPRIWLVCKLWLLDHLIPAHDSGVREKRVDVLMQKHEESVKLLEAQFPKQKLWYLEVIAVHPSLQCRGLGGGVMRWVLEHINNEPVYLECTRQENVAFYESFGFKVAEVVEMFEDGSRTDGDHGFKHWVMAHPGKDEN